MVKNFPNFIKNIRSSANAKQDKHKEIRKWTHYCDIVGAKNKEILERRKRKVIPHVQRVNIIISNFSLEMIVSKSVIFSKY